MKEIVDKIVREMKNQGITAKKLEEDTQIGVNTIAVWKRGTQPTVEKLIKVIKYLGISADTLFEINTDNRTSDEKALEELRYMRKVFNLILDSDDIKDIHELALGGIDYATKEHKKILENM